VAITCSLCATVAAASFAACCLTSSLCYSALRSIAAWTAIRCYCSLASARACEAVSLAVSAASAEAISCFLLSDSFFCL
jgi:hypothetical protein